MLTDTPALTSVFPGSGALSDKEPFPLLSSAK